MFSSEFTNIRYFIPDNSHDAKIEILDLTGKVIDSIDISDKGNGVINLGAEKLSSGQYIYTLIIDGQIIESKKMIKQ